MSNQNYIPKPRVNFGDMGGYPEVKAFVEAVENFIDPIDLPILQALGLTKGLFDNKGKEFLFLNSSLFLPLSSKTYKKALSEGNLLVFKKQFLSYDLPFLKDKQYDGLEFDPDSFIKELEIKPELSLENKLILTKGSDLTKDIITLVNDLNGRLITYEEVYTEALTETEVSIEDIETFLHNQGAILNQDIPLSEGGVALLKRFKRFQVYIRFNKELGVWMWSEAGKSTRPLRRFYSINNKPIPNPHLAFLLALNYFLSASNERELKGRINLVPNLFSDRINVGFSTPICENFTLNKLGLLGLSIRLFPGSHNLIVIKRGGDLLTSVGRYEQLNYSTFVHKTGKYAVIEAECFTRLPQPEALIEYITRNRNEVTDSGIKPEELNNLLNFITQNIKEEDVYRQAILNGFRDSLSKVILISRKRISSNKWFTETSWQADKLSKLTGRALSHVPTAGYWKRDNEKEDESISVKNTKVESYLAKLYS